MEVKGGPRQKVGTALLDGRRKVGPEMPVCPHSEAL